MAVRGIDSLRSPFGQSPRKLVVCPTGCAATQPILGLALRGQSKLCSKTLPAFLCRTRSGAHPLGLGIHIAKSPYFCTGSQLKYGGEGIDSLRSPFGQSPRRLVVCPTGCASCRTPVGGSHPLGLGDTYKQKARTSVQALNLNMAVRGIRTPIRCRIHTFQACSFSHSDTHQIVAPALLERALM